MRPFVTLMLAIVSEIIATNSLKVSEGFTKPLPSIVVVVGYVAAFYLLSLTLRSIPISAAYAIWSGLGTAGTVLIGVLVWRETLDLPRLAGIILIIAGVLLLNMVGGETAHA